MILAKFISFDVIQLFIGNIPFGHNQWVMSYYDSCLSSSTFYIIYFLIIEIDTYIYSQLEMSVALEKIEEIYEVVKVTH